MLHWESPEYWGIEEVDVTAWLYILKCADGSYYTGSTTNLPLRVAEHNAGEGSDYTRRRLPVELVYSQEFPTEHDAFLRERQVKGWSRAKKEALVRGDFEALVSLSKSRASPRDGSSGSDLTDE
jgi:putative endonuclease